jgi:hypothetical protein
MNIGETRMVLVRNAPGRKDWTVAKPVPMM